MALREYKCSLRLVTDTLDQTVTNRFNQFWTPTLWSSWSMFSVYAHDAAGRDNVLNAIVKAALQPEFATDADTQQNRILQSMTSPFVTGASWGTGLGGLHESTAATMTGVDTLNQAIDWIINDDNGTAHPVQIAAQVHPSA